MDGLKLLLRPNEVAEALGISRTRAYELISCGDIPCIRLGTSVRVSADALKAWVNRRQVATDDPNPVLVAGDVA